MKCFSPQRRAFLGCGCMKAETKAELRKRLRAIRPDAAAVQAESRRICQVIREWNGFRQAQCIAAYMPLPHEPDILPLLQEALAEGKELLLPRVNHGEMSFYRVDELKTLVTGAFGIREPSAGQPMALLAQAQLILIPLEAVDRQGNRLGKGGGYYDRALGEAGGMRLGIARQGQVIERVPVEAHDVALDGWADPEGIHIITKAR